MNPSKILAFLAQGTGTPANTTARFGAGSSDILTALLEEGSVHLSKGRYTINDDGYTSSVLSYQCGEPVVYFPKCASTNDIADRKAKEGWTGVVTTDFQERGRGRLGRVWQSSSADNLLFSMVVRPQISVPQASRITLVWAAEIADELDLYVKWPNDIVDDQDRKVGGLLSSVHLVDNRVEYIVFGVGLNVNQHDFQGLPHAISLSALRKEPQSRNVLLQRLVKRVRDVDPLKDFSLWKKLSRTLGRKVRIGSVEGIASTIREDGALIVSGIPVLTGDVHLLEGE